MLDTAAQPLFSFRGPMGVRVDVVPSFLLLAGVFVLFDPSVRALGFFAMIAVSIFLHEFGHAWGALVQGVSVQRVVMWGGGGLCYHGGTPDPRKREFITIMGPLVNLALWAIASLASTWLYGQLDQGAFNGFSSDTGWEIAWQLHLFAWINLVLFGINMIPVNPLDGGRLFFFMLWRVTKLETASRIAGGLGVVASVLWIPAAIYVFITWGYILFFIPSVQHHLAIYRGQSLP
ncbi:site-2 protease family protein [Jannaschia pohangensis]|uniref:Zn-dependent protease (Includes SpoIVFB) n=1 Tax=Jannaschia pohangensis TaxID=390807 RepID=A0A1I3QBY4_9RHOB|nr:site-2 protease family protein [Jannaschia pohangensis]SFJ31205.1 Zn-dependent protease (includes SpoIVFB) [Jannaschia pohangensis]